jgi:hypothetical protein
MLQYGIRAIGSRMDLYGPRNNTNLSKFVVAYFVLCEFGGTSGEIQSQIPKFMVKINV